MTLGEGFWTRLWLGGSAGTKTGQAVDDLAIWLFWFCTIWFVFLMGLTVYFVIKYRRRPGVAAPRSRSHNTPLEIVWTIIPTLFLIYIFFAGFERYMNNVIPGANPEQIDLVAKKWVWSLIYPNGMTTAQFEKIDEDHPSEYPVFVVPADYPVLFRMTSDDVIHSFWVPDFRLKFDVFPNRYTSYQFRADKLTEADPVDSHGRRFRDHTVFCAEYCGDQHSDMLAIIRVMSIEDYKDWVTTGGVSLGELTPVEAGAIVAKQKGCVTCHSSDGTRMTGPSWKGGTDPAGGATGFGYEIPLESGSTVLFDDNYVRESVLSPAAKLHRGFPNQMPTYQGRMSDDELRYIIAYMKSLSDKAPTSLIDDAGQPGEDQP